MNQMHGLAEMLMSGWQNYYHLILPFVALLLFVLAFCFLKKSKNQHEEEMETPTEIHLRGDLLPFHTPPLETKSGGIVEKAVTPEVATAEKKSLLPRRIKKKMPVVVKKKTQQHHKKDSAPKKALSKTKETVVTKMEKKVIVPTIVAQLPAPPSTPAVVVSKKDKKPVKKKVKKLQEKKVYPPHKPMIGELIQMPTKTEVKTENVPHTQTAATV